MAGAASHHGCGITTRITAGLAQLHESLQATPHSRAVSPVDCTGDDGTFDPTPPVPLLANRYRYIKKIGRGSFAVIIRAEDTYDPKKKHVAIKIMHSQYREIGVHEYNHSRDLTEATGSRAARIIQCLNRFEFGPHFCIVFELLSITPLRHCIDVATSRGGARQVSGHALRLHAVRKVAAQLLAALAFLKRERVIHADIKPDNILLEDNDAARCSVKLCDFGNSLEDTAAARALYASTAEVQSLWYRAPEIIVGVTPWGTPIDMWSAGCIIAELFLGEPLFHGTNNAQMIEQIYQLLGPLPHAPYAHGTWASDVPPHVIAPASNLRVRTPERIPRQDNADMYSPSPAREQHRRQVKRMAERLGTTDRAFATFVVEMLTYAPEQRLTPVGALQHAFMAPLFPFGLCADTPPHATVTAATTPSSQAAGRRSHARAFTSAAERRIARAAAKGTSSPGSAKHRGAKSQRATAAPAAPHSPARNASPDTGHGGHAQSNNQGGGGEAAEVRGNVVPVAQQGHAGSTRMSSCAGGGPHDSHRQNTPPRHRDDVHASPSSTTRTHGSRTMTPRRRMKQPQSPDSSPQNHACDVNSTQHRTAAHASRVVKPRNGVPGTDKPSDDAKGATAGRHSSEALDPSLTSPPSPQLQLQSATLVSFPKSQPSRKASKGSPRTQGADSGTLKQRTPNSDDVRTRLRLSPKKVLTDDKRYAVHASGEAMADCRSPRRRKHHRTAEPPRGKSSRSGQAGPAQSRAPKGKQSRSTQHVHKRHRRMPLGDIDDVARGNATGDTDASSAFEGATTDGNSDNGEDSDDALAMFGIADRESPAAPEDDGSLACAMFGLSPEKKAMVAELDDTDVILV
eukprot:m.33929 g.33929  ORF g.33929 m.33929 type:complete len:854 (-) comp14273_c0_seq2:190-2751(-)